MACHCFLSPSSSCIAGTHHISLISGFLSLLTQPAQYLLKCDDLGDRRPNVSVNPRAYPSLVVRKLEPGDNWAAIYLPFTKAICQYGAGCACTKTGLVMCSGSPTNSVHMIFTAFQDYCINHCVCAVQPEDLNRQQYHSNRKSENKENTRPKRPIPVHVCSGTCTEVARSCSWAYTGECMCTAASVPDPWGLFASHGCAAVVKSSLGGRDVASNQSSPNAMNSSSATPPQINTIVQGSKGYYNASTGVQVACPCNSTCVSYGCCGSNGMTQAPEDRCLGKLDIASDDIGAKTSDDSDEV